MHYYELSQHSTMIVLAIQLPAKPKQMMVIAFDSPQKTSAFAKKLQYASLAPNNSLKNEIPPAAVSLEAENVYDDLPDISRSRSSSHSSSSAVVINENMSNTKSYANSRSSRSNSAHASSIQQRALKPEPSTHHSSSSSESLSHSRASRKEQPSSHSRLYDGVATPDAVHSPSPTLADLTDSATPIKQLTQPEKKRQQSSASMSLASDDHHSIHTNASMHFENKPLKTNDLDGKLLDKAVMTSGSEMLNNSNKAKKSNAKNHKHRNGRSRSASSSSSSSFSSSSSSSPSRSSSSRSSTSSTVSSYYSKGQRNSCNVSHSKRSSRMNSHSSDRRDSLLILASGKFQPLSTIDKPSTRDTSTDNISPCSICGGKGEGSQRILKMISDDKHEPKLSTDGTIYMYSRTLPVEYGNGKSMSKKPHSHSRSPRCNGHKHRSQKHPRNSKTSHRDSISMEHIKCQKQQYASGKERPHTIDGIGNQRYSEPNRRSSCAIYICDDTDSDSSTSADVSLGMMVQNKQVIQSRS